MFSLYLPYGIGRDSPLSSNQLGEKRANDPNSDWTADSPPKRIRLSLENMEPLVESLSTVAQPTSAVVNSQSQDVVGEAAGLAQSKVADTGPKMAPSLGDFGAALVTVFEDLVLKQQRQREIERDEEEKVDEDAVWSFVLHNKEKNVALFRYRSSTYLAST